MKKFFIYLFVIIITLLLTIVGLLYADIWDIEPPDVSDLEIKYVEVPPEDNAFTYLKQASESIKMSDEEYDKLQDMLNSNKTNDQFCLKFIEENEVVIKLLKTAAECEKFYLPKAKTSTDFFETFGLKTLQLYSLLRVWTQFNGGDLPLKLSKVLVLGRQGTPISVMMGHLCLKKSINDLTGKLCLIDNSHLRRTYALFDDVDFITIRDAYIDSLKNENRNFGKILDGLGTSGNKYISGAELLAQEENNLGGLYDFPYLFHYNRTKLLNAQIVRHHMTHLKKTQFIESDFFLKMRKKHIKSYPSPNCVGNIVVLAYGRCFDSVVKKYFETCFWLDSVKSSIACELYRRKHGELPESLDVLVPDFLENVPNDPFDGKPLRYSKEKKIIYSVGENLVDSGGLGEREIDKIKNGSKRRKARDREDLVFYLTPEKAVSK